MGREGICLLRQKIQEAVQFSLHLKMFSKGPYTPLPPDREPQGVCESVGLGLWSIVRSSPSYLAGFDEECACLHRFIVSFFTLSICFTKTGSADELFKDLISEFFLFLTFFLKFISL